MISLYQLHNMLDMLATIHAPCNHGDRVPVSFQSFEVERGGGGVQSVGQKVTISYFALWNVYIIM